MMSWTAWLAERRIQRHETSLRELTDLRAVVARDLADAALTAVSTDRRYATAYNAALQLSKMVITCSGYRVSGAGHHRMTFEALELAMGPSASPFSAYFDACRRKRNTVEYDVADVASETETEQLIETVLRFQGMVESWIAANHPELSSSQP